MKTTLSVAFALAAAMTTLPAQTAAESAAPRAQITIETVGPDGWRARLGPTNLGGMLGSEEGRALWGPQVMPALGFWQMLVGDEQLFAAARDRLFGYAGAIRVALRFSTERGVGAAPAAAFVLEGDGRTSLTELAADLRLVLTRGAPGEWSEQDVGGSRRAVRGDDTLVACEPFVRGDRLLLLFAPPGDLDASLALADALCAQPLTVGPKLPTSPALRLTFDAQALLDISELRHDDDSAAITAALGFGSLDTVTLTIGGAGPRVQAELAVSFRGQDRGLFSAFMPSSVGVSALGRLLPKETTGWKVGRFDSLALGKAVLAAVDALDDDANARAEVARELGCDLLDDVLAHMTDELLVLGSPLRHFERAREATFAVAFGLRDEAKFRLGMTKVLAEAGPLMDKAETIDVDGVELWRYGNLLRYDTYVAIGNGMFVFAGGRDGEEVAAELLRAAKRDGLEDQTAPRVADLRRHLPDGLQGLAFLDVGAIAATPSEWWFELIEEVVPFAARTPEEDLEEAEEHRERARALLTKHRLDAVRTASGYADATWRWRLYW